MENTQETKAELQFLTEDERIAFYQWQQEKFSTGSKDAYHHDGKLIER